MCPNIIPGALDSGSQLRGSEQRFPAVPEPLQSMLFESLLHTVGEKIASLKAGSLKQLLPDSSNF